MDVGVGNGAVGAYLTGKDGKTFYVFTPDSATEHVHRPVRDELAAVQGLGRATPKADSAVTGLLSTFARADGTQQVVVA